MITAKALIDGTTIQPQDLPECSLCRTVGWFIVIEQNRAPAYVCHQHLTAYLDRADTRARRATQLNRKHNADLVIDRLDYVLDRRLKEAYGRLEYAVRRLPVEDADQLFFF